MTNSSLSLARTEEQDSLQASVASWLRSAGFPRRPDIDTTAVGLEDTAWHQFNDAFGLLGISVPAAIGGAGGHLDDVWVAFEEAGAALYSGPFLPAMVATNMLEKLPAAADVLQEQLSGTTLVLPADLDVALRGEPSDARLLATGDGDDVTVTGRTAPFLSGAGLARLLVPARVGNELGLVAVDPLSVGATLESLIPLDLSRSWARLDCSRAPGLLLCVGDAASEVLSGALEVAMTCSAAEQLGVARQSLRNTVEYVQSRYQFGRPVGSFQAVKHRLADLLIRCEQGYGSLDNALQSSVERSGPLAQASALVLASRAAVETTLAAIQLSGGVAMTWEYPAHLYMRRAIADERAFGGVDTLLATIADEVLPPAPRAAHEQGEE